MAERAPNPDGRDGRTRPRAASAASNRARYIRGGSDDAPLIDDAKAIQDRERESELAGALGCALPGVVRDFNGEHRLNNDVDPALDSDRDAGDIVRLLRRKAGPHNDPSTPIPPPPRRDA